MTYAKQSGGGPGNRVPLPLTASPQLARWVSLASTQNRVPVLRELVVELSGPVAATALEFRITANPPFLHPMSIRLDRLDPTGPRVLDVTALHPDFSFLAGLTEAIEGHLVIEASAEGFEKVTHTAPLRLLPADQWEGLSDIPELLAAHVQPNHPVVGQILSTAGGLLKKAQSGLSGYQQGSRDGVGLQVAAIFAAIRQCDFAYVNPPAHFHEKGQRLRLPDQIQRERLATCLDLAVLFAACLEQAGLHPLIFMSDGHAWGGCWLDEGSSSASPVDEDGQAFRKRLAVGELLAIEVTTLTHKSSLFADAQRLGREHTDNEAAFEAALDIRLARQSGIRPIPVRVNGQFEVPQEPAAALNKLESATIIEGSAPKGADPDAEPINSRLERWKRKLLDLTLRNKLVNFKPNAKTLRIVGTGLGLLEDSLASHKAFSFEVNPRFDTQKDPSTGNALPASVALERLAQLAQNALGRQKLVTELDDKEKLVTRLTELYRNSRTAEEESGVSPLFLALGILEWKETERSTAVVRAPILLVPVELDRSSVKAGLGGFTLLSRDEDTRINPTLLEKLRKDFGIAFDISDTPPADESGVDVPRILKDFRHLVIDRKGWEVKEEIWLGEFSFKKFLMWRDLEDREAVLRRHPLVFQMLEHPNTPIPSQGAFPEARELDAKCPPGDVFAPLLADSSQLAAIQAASEGKSFVLEGPPGTGKSQTITNLISHCMAHGKTVLFVSEKKAALDVVRKRLDKVGLGTYCLEVHSDKARKTEIIEQLRAPLEPFKSPSRNKWPETTSALSTARQKLNLYVEALHRRYPCGLTIYEATGWLCGHPVREAIALKWGDPNDWQRPPLSELRSLVAEMQPILEQLGELKAHPFQGSQLDDSSPVIERAAKASADAARKAIIQLKEAVDRVTGRLGITTKDLSRTELDSLVEFSQALIHLDKAPATIGSLIGQPAKLATLRASARLLEQRQEHAKIIEALFLPALYAADIKAMDTLQREATSSWWPKSILRKRALSRQLAPLLKDKRGEAAAVAALPDAVRRAQEIKQVDASISAHDAELTLALGDWWHGAQTSPELLLKAVVAAEGLQAQMAKLSRQNAGRMATLVEHTRSLLELGFNELRNGGALAQEFSGVVGKHQAAHQELRKLLNDLFVNASPVADAAASYLAHIYRWIDGVRQALDTDQLRFWTAWRRLRTRGQSVGLAALIDRRDAATPQGSLVDLFEASARQWLLEEGLSRSEPLKNFIGRSHNQLIKEFSRLDGEYLELVKCAAAARVDALIPREGLEGGINQEYALLHRELGKKSRHKSVRQLFAGMPGLMAKMKPCLLMSPLSVAQHLDAEFPPFDLVVFDEASQIPVWDAIGAIARAKQAIVVGDPKQMPPTAFFSRDDTGDEDQPDMIEELESILDETMTSLPIRRLEWHYRSRYESLITFSNRHYYEGKLVTFPSPVARDQAVQLHRVDGVYGRGSPRTNRKEADEVVNFVLEHLRGTDTKDTSIGVVTFNIQQKQLIEDLLDAARREDAALEPYFAKGPGKEEVFVKNLENVQGDERDVIVFSTTFGPDQVGKLSVNFGPINHASGPRRLNVAITRSRLAMHVFSSIPPERLDASRTTAVGVRHLKEFLEYADRGVAALNQASSALSDDPDSPFEEAVASALRAKGWEIHHQIGCGGYRIDLGVVNPKKPGTYLAGVECDGASYHSAATARDRDRLRQAKLEELGWTLHRIWSTEWWRRPQEEIARIQSSLQQKLAEQDSVVNAGH